MMIDTVLLNDLFYNLYYEINKLSGVCHAIPFIFVDGTIFDPAHILINIAEASKILRGLNEKNNTNIR